MKLIDIVKMHLSQWPADVNFIAQDVSQGLTGNIYGYDKRPVSTNDRVWRRGRNCQGVKILVSGAHIADDFRTAIISKDDFTLATLNIGAVATPSGITDINALRDRIIALDGILSAAKVERSSIVEALRLEGLTYIGVVNLLEGEKVNWRSLKVGDTIKITEETDDLPANAVVVVKDIETAGYNGSQPLFVEYEGNSYWPDADERNNRRVFDFVLIKRA